MNFLVSIVGLAFLILIHEAGHFAVALGVRMRPRRFYVFFPPALVRRVHNGIEYGIGSIPLGGYVKIPGMHKPAGRDLGARLGRAREEAPWLERYSAPAAAALDEGDPAEARAAVRELRAAVERAELNELARRDAEHALEDVDDGLSDDAYWRAPVWKRVAVIVAGPATNLVFALVVIAIVFMLGVPVDTTRRIESVDLGTPAAAIGLRSGDQVVAIDGEPVAPDEIAARIRATEGAPVTLRVRRGEETLSLTGRARQTEGVYRLGFQLGAVNERAGPWHATKLAADRTWLVTKAIGSSLGRIVTGNGRDEVSSPVGIVQASSEAADVGYREYLGLLALISLSLALLNLLPFLPLDGGHIAFSLAEAIRGRAIPREAYERASMVGIVLVLFLFFLGLTNDIDRIRGG
jgi:regulator of sigma E protease